MRGQAPMGTAAGRAAPERTDTCRYRLVPSATRQHVLSQDALHRYASANTGRYRPVPRV